MSTAEAKIADVTKTSARIFDHWRVVKAAAAVLIPLAICVAPLGDRPQHARGDRDLGVPDHRLDDGADGVRRRPGLLGLMLFWFFDVAGTDVIFSGFVSETSWFYVGANADRRDGREVRSAASASQIS
jgi:hypothetical protein